MRSTITFLSGFIAGMLFLLILLWSHGSLHPVPVAAAAPAPAPDAAMTTKPPVSPPAQPPAAAATATAADVPPLIVPVQGVHASQILDTFADARAGHTHEAADIMAPRGTPVLAAADGTIVKLFQSKAGGTTIYQFDPTRTWCFYYAHLDHYAPGTVEGATLRQGQVIGYVGSTGDASPEAPHLHFAIFRLGPEKHWWQGTAINPYPILMRSARE